MPIEGAEFILAHFGVGEAILEVLRTFLGARGGGVTERGGKQN